MGHPKYTWHSRGHEQHERNCAEEVGRFFFTQENDRMIKGEQNNSRTTCCGEGGGWRVNKEIALRYVLKTRCQCVVQQIGISAFTGTEDRSVSLKGLYLWNKRTHTHTHQVSAERSSIVIRLPITVQHTTACEALVWNPTVTPAGHLGDCFIYET